MWKYRHMPFRPGYKHIGFLGVPFFTFGEMLAPLIELPPFVPATHGAG